MNARALTLMIKEDYIKLLVSMKSTRELFVLYMTMFVTMTPIFTNVIIILK